MRSCAIHVHKHGLEALLLQRCREVTAVILSITPWLPTYMGQSLIRCNMYDKAAEDGALEGRITALVTYKDGMLFRKGKVWIPSDPSLRKLIMESEHDCRVAGHKIGRASCRERVC